MLNYLEYTLYLHRGNRALRGYTNTSLPAKTVTTDIARKDNDKLSYKDWDIGYLVYLLDRWKEVIHYSVSKRFY